MSLDNVPVFQSHSFEGKLYALTMTLLSLMRVSDANLEELTCKRVIDRDMDDCRLNDTINVRPSWDIDSYFPLSGR